MDRQFAKQLNFEDVKFRVHRKVHSKIENKITFPLVSAHIKKEHHTIFILQSKILKIMLIYYKYLEQKILIMF